MLGVPRSCKKEWTLSFQIKCVACHATLPPHIRTTFLSIVFVVCLRSVEQTSHINGRCEWRKLSRRNQDVMDNLEMVHWSRPKKLSYRFSLRSWRDFARECFTTLVLSVLYWDIPVWKGSTIVRFILNHDTRSIQWCLVKWNLWKTNLLCVPLYH